MSVQFIFYDFSMFKRRPQYVRGLKNIKWTNMEVLKTSLGRSIEKISRVDWEIIWMSNCKILNVRFRIAISIQWLQRYWTLL